MIIWKKEDGGTGHRPAPASDGRKRYDGEGGGEFD